MTPEQRYKRIDGHIERTAMYLKLSESRAHVSEVRTDKIDARIEQILALAERDAENIRALARIAEIHERRLSDLEGGEQRH